MYDLVVKNGLVVLPDRVQKLDVAVRDGRFVALGEEIDACDAQVLDAAGYSVLPGVVDAHVHFNDPGLTDREDLYTGTAAAAAGGTTTVIDMPLSGSPTVTTVGVVGLKRRTAHERAVVDYALWGGLVTDNTAELAAMSAAGVVAFKAFTCFAGDDFPYATTATLYRGMKEALETDALIGVHCEDRALVECLEAQARARGETTVRSFLDAHAPITETLAVDIVLHLAQETGARVHICHASLPEVVDAVRLARAQGARVTAETCPHYLVFAEDDLERLGAVLKCTPPVRTQAAREALWDLLLDGAIDMIASDHSPSTAALKSPPGGSFWDAWGGVQGVQLMLPVMYTEAVEKRGMSLDALMCLLARNPAEIFGLHPRKGEIAPGGDADFVLFDTTAVWTVTADALLHKNRHTPYMGMELRGRVAETYVRGRQIFAEGRIRTTSGGGRFVTRENEVNRV